VTAVALAFDGTRVDSADTLGTVWTDTAGKACISEADIIWQGNGCASEKVSNTTLGVAATFGTAVNFTTTPKVMMIKCNVTTINLLNNEGSTGGQNWVGSNGVTSNWYEYYTFGKDTYRPIGGWLFPFIDPTVTAWRDNTNGTPALGSVNMAATEITTTGSSKSENVMMDAIDYCDSGKGLTLTAGTGADPPGTFQDFVDYDQGNTSNRWGVVIAIDNAIFCNLFLTIGTVAAATEFDSSNEAIIFPNHRVDAGAQGIKFDLGNASSVFSVVNGSFKSVGRDNLKRFFDTDHQIDATNDEIDYVGHGYETGEAVLYSKEGGTQTTGLTDATEYWVEAVSADVISLHTSRQNAMTAATPVSLTASTLGNSENHSFRRQPRTTFDFTVSGTSGTMALTGCVFNRPSIITSTSKPDWTLCTFVAPWQVTVAGADFANCTFDGAMTVEGEALVSDTVINLEKVINSTFNAGEYGGSAWKVTGAASTLDLTNVSFNGYGNDPGDGNGMAFDTITGVDATNDEIDYTGHGWTTGDAVYYSKYDPTDGSAGTDTIGLSDGGLYYVRAVTVDTLSLYRTRYAAINVSTDKITLSDGATGETHTLYSADAAIVNNTGGAMQINVTGGTSPSVRNIAGATSTVVSGAVPFTVTVVDEDSDPIVNARVHVPVAASGPYPYQATVSMVRSGTTVTVTHSGHGLATNDYVLITGTTENGYWGVHQITVTGANAYTYQLPAHKTPTSPATGAPKATFMILYGLTNASGVVSASRSYSTDQPYQAGWTRKGTGSPIYQDGSIPAGTLDKDVGVTITVPMNGDE
jgi:hypothetical protein